MFVIALAMLLASNGPVCQKLCDTDVYDKALRECLADNTKLESDLTYCKAVAHRVIGANQDLVDESYRCSQDLKDAQAKQCKPKKSAPKKKAVVVVKKEEPKTCCAVQAPPVVNVTVNVDQNQAQAQDHAGDGAVLVHVVREDPFLLFGVRGAGGAAICTPTGIGLLGARLNILPIHLGLDVYTEFANATVGAQLLLYPIQTPGVMWHVNGGFVWFNQRPFITPDLPRQVDLTLGTGLEFRVLPFLWVTADLQARMANPVAVAASGQQFSTVLGKSLLQTQGMLGLMLRTW